jgi:hypothetical protein
MARYLTVWKTGGVVPPKEPRDGGSVWDDTALQRYPCGAADCVGNPVWQDIGGSPRDGPVQSLNCNC